MRTVAGTLFSVAHAPVPSNILMIRSYLRSQVHVIHPHELYPLTDATPPPKKTRAPPGVLRGGADIVTSLLEKSCKRGEQPNSTTSITWHTISPRAGNQFQGQGYRRFSRFSQEITKGVIY